MEFAVRRARSGDLDRLVEFTIAEAREAEGIHKPIENVYQGIETGLSDETISTYWVLENDRKQLVGNVSVVREWSDWNSGFYWWIQSMFIIPEYRGKGLANLLLQAIKEAAKKEKVIELRLYVHDQNDRAIRAYQKLGFRDSPYKIMTIDI